MSNESFGMVILVIISTLYIVGLGSLLASCFYDNKYQETIVSTRKHYYHKYDDDETASIILIPEDNNSQST